MNHLLAALTPECLGDLDLQEAYFEAGHRLHEAGQTVEQVYFPFDAIVSHSAEQDDGGAVETGTVGREGLVSVMPLIGDGIAYENAVVQVPGRIAFASVDAVRGRLDGDPGFRRLIGAYAQAYAAQVAQSVVCNATHPDEARLSRWLLMCLDRRDDGILPLSTRFIAEMLGVSRPMVTVVAGTLQTAGFIRLTSASIEVLDRASLEEAACDCYGRVRHAFERLLPGSYARQFAKRRSHLSAS